jgi:predicted DNA-binding transcriptional regulator YafY
MTDTIEFDIRFSVIPDWVIDSHISNGAFRLYALLAQYRNNNDVSRENLALRLKCSAKTVDRAMAELKAIGAVKTGGK